MGFGPRPSSARAFVPMLYINTMLKARKGEAFLLGSQDFQMIKISMKLASVRGRGNLIEDDPEDLVIHSFIHFFLHSTSIIPWVRDFNQVEQTSHL